MSCSQTGSKDLFHNRHMLTKKKEKNKGTKIKADLFLGEA